MPWKETCAMDEKNRFIDAYSRKDRSVTELCLVFGISRKTGYKWLRRYDAQGRGGLAELSHARHEQPVVFGPEAKQRILELKQEFPYWGARKLLVVAKRRHSELVLPSHTTVYAFLKSQGLCRATKRRHRPPSEYSPYSGYYGPNACWSADYKGEFSLGNQRLCYPLTLSDVRSRFFLRCQSLPHTRTKQAQTVFDSAFCEYGLPDVIRTDNGAPFASRAPGGLSVLSIHWIRLGIKPHRIQPARPTQNSRHERMHKTLLEECPIGKNHTEQQAHFNRFMHIYNTERPHESLNNKVPADIYCDSSKRYPCKDKDPEYPSDFFVERLDKHGGIRFAANTGFISPLLAGQLIGLKRIEQRLFDLFFGPVYLGQLNPKGFKPLTRKSSP